MIREAKKPLSSKSPWQLEVLTGFTEDGEPTVSIQHAPNQDRIPFQKFDSGKLADLINDLTTALIYLENTQPQ